MNSSGKAHYKIKGLKPAAYSAPVLSGTLLILAFPPFEQGYLAWIALTPLLWFCLKAAPRQAFLAAYYLDFPSTSILIYIYRVYS